MGLKTMINILIPLAGKNTFQTSAINTFPKILSDVGGSLLVERAAKPFIDLEFSKNIVIALPKNESEKFRLNKVLPLLGEDISLCNINSKTQGAACSALLAIEHINLEAPLIISSFEQVLDFELTSFINNFIESKVDAGVLTFEAIHPKWSYVKVGDDQLVTQAAEKMPISKNAIAGLFYFKTAKSFFDAAQSMIRKDVKVNNLFFIAPTLNEIILSGGKVKALPIDKSRYYHINDEHSLENFEESIVAEKKHSIQLLTKLTKDYVAAFSAKNIDMVKSFISDDFRLVQPGGNMYGSEDAVQYINSFFVNNESLDFVTKKTLVTSDRNSVVEFELTLDEGCFLGSCVFHWNKKHKMSKMNIYLNRVKIQEQ
ncbi:MAG: nuclear transport factor 2 family protein [Motiliproteus sp.]